MPVTATAMSASLRESAPVAIARAWRPATRLVVCSHASNVTGTVQDAAAIAAIAHDRDGILLLDASQSLGQIPGTGVASGDRKSTRLNSSH